MKAARHTNLFGDIRMVFIHEMLFIEDNGRLVACVIQGTVYAKAQKTLGPVSQKCPFVMPVCDCRGFITGPGFIRG